MRRREFLGVLGCAVALPLAARAQQTMPVIGFIDSRSPETLGERLRKFRQGLKDSGYAEGENIAIEYRWAENQASRLPELAADLVRRQVGVIVSSGGIPVAFAAKAATATIPIVFLTADDPVRLGIVASLARPGGNMTGINFFNTELVAKRLGLLREMLPRAAAHRSARQSQRAGQYRSRRCATWMWRLKPWASRSSVFRADTSRAIDAAFAENWTGNGLTRCSSGRRPSSTHGASNWSNWQRHRRESLGYSVAANISEIGGLMSYGADYLGCVIVRSASMPVFIVKGAKPADMPVVQPTKFELVINAQTARCSASRTAHATARRRRGYRVKRRRVHHTARGRGGCVADDGACTTERTDAPCWRADESRSR